MSDLPSHARAVVIGCGIVGNSLAHHLCRLGWRDVLLLDQEPPPIPCRSTGNSSTFLSLDEHTHSIPASSPPTA